MAEEKKKYKKHRHYKYKISFLITTLILLFVLIGFGLYLLVININSTAGDRPGIGKIAISWKDKERAEKERQEAAAEQERLKKEKENRRELISQADQLALGYDYDGAIGLIQGYSGKEGGYQVYTELVSALERLEQEKGALKLYGGSYRSVTEINHIFFHILIQEPSKAFDSDYKAAGYNMYMTTVSEFKKMMQKMYEDGYVLVRMSDLIRTETLADGSTKYVQNEIYLREGKKPFVLSEDDVSYYEYMTGDGFASRIIIGEDGKPTCEMLLEDGTTVTGAFDIVPILNEFIEQHPDFSYKGAKGLLALTGYEGILGYRTNDPTSPTYEKDRQEAKRVVEVLKEDGWEIGSHSWGHKDLQKLSVSSFKKDTQRWMEEVGSIVGPTDIYVFPYGIDIEASIGAYSGEKYNYLREFGFTKFIGVFKDPWMKINKDYMRMTRRPLDGQAMLEFPERLADLFDVKDIIDPERPGKDW